MKWSILFVLLNLSAASWGQIGAKTNNPDLKIQGKWVNTSFGYAMELILNQGGQGSFDGEKMSYSISGNELTTNWSGNSVKYTFVLNGNILTLSGGDLDGTISFSRENASSQPSIQASGTNNNSPSSLIGTWTGQGEEMSFAANGTMKYNVYDMKYSISGNTLTMQSPNGNVSFEYSINQGQLLLSSNGQVFYYQSSNPSNGVTNSPTSAQGNVTRDLVGKWCYVNVTSNSSGGWSTDECFTLYENGTYEYHSENSGSAAGYNSYGNQTYAGGRSGSNVDRGTWSVSGSTLIVDSQSQGRINYTFQKKNHPKNNDPMIVINGRSYVTFYQKSPW
jgi:hypothetical protein